MYYLKYIFLLGLFAFGSSPIWAQDPLGGKDTLTLENDRIEDVIESEKPNLKLPYQQIKKGDVTDIQYRSKQFPVDTDFEPAPPRARKLEEIEKEDLPIGFLKLGISRFITPVAQLYLNNEREGEYDLGFNFNHQSVHNDKVELRRFRQNSANLDGTYFMGDNQAKGNLSFYNTTYFNYADSVAGATPEVREDSLKMGFSRLAIGGSLLTSYNPEIEYDYDLSAGVRYYGDRRKNNEFHLVINPSGGYTIEESFRIGLSTNFTFVRGDIAGDGQSRTFFEAYPNISYKSDVFSASAGVVYNAFNNNSDTSSFSNFGPKIEVSVALLEEFNIFAGYSTGMKHNHYYDMIFENPYLANNVLIRPTVEKMNIFGGLQGSIGQKADFSAKVYYKRIENPLIYAIQDNNVYFDALYDSLTKVFGVHLEMNYDIAEDIRVGTALSYNNYNTSTVVEYFHASPVRLDIYGAYTWEEKLTLNGELNLFGPTPFAVDENDEIINRDIFVGVNLSADYRISNRFSVFLALNNILSTNYQRWYNYPGRPIDFQGGLTVAF